MVSNKIVSQLEFFKNLAEANTVKKHQILSTITDDQLEALVEICYNICGGRFKLEKRQLGKLKKHKDFIRQLSHKRTPKAAKFVVQKGGSFPFAALLLPIILHVLQNDAKVLSSPPRSIRRADEQ